MSAEGGPLTVKATHNFKGTNNDELCFKKGDVITVSQVVEGGWWEGTLNGLTGWFPSNYVKDHKNDGVKVSKSGTIGVIPENDVQIKPQDMEKYRGVVFKDILSTELHHVQEMNQVWNNYLLPLKHSECLNDKDWNTLAGNFEEVHEMQKTLLASLESANELSPKDQKIGGAFMQVAPLLKKVHLEYCANHAKAVAVIEKHKESLNKFIEEQNSSLSILLLTTGLSCPFRRLEKYPALLQELQRHTEESHIDRGDTQRAVFVYRDLSTFCQNKRRQKEMEFEVMSGSIRGWEGDDIQTLGTILHMAVVTMVTDDQKKKDRHLVLFPQACVILAVSSRLSAFIYKGKLPLSGLILTKMEGDNPAHLFELSAPPSVPKFSVSCHTRDDLDTWLCLLSRQHVKIVNSALPTVPARSNVSMTTAMALVTPTLVDSVGRSSGGVVVAPPTLPPHVERQNSFLKASPKKVWTMWSLRPHPPLRTCPPMAKKDEVVLRRAANKKKEKTIPDEKAYEEDMRVLQVIEAYCNSAKTRYTVNSAMMDCPQMIIAEDEKIIVEEMRGTTQVVQERSLVDTVYALKDQVKDLKEETAGLAKGLVDERKARKKLEELVKKHLGGGIQMLGGILED